MRVGYYQFRPVFGRPQANLRRILKALDAAEAHLIVLPELALSGYYFADAAEALRLSEDPAASPRLDALAELCQRRKLHLVLGFAERAGEHCYNSAALIGPGGIIDIYRKLHLFGGEKHTLTAGDRAPRVHAVHDARVAMIICFDWAFPELSRMLALRGVQILCHPCNLVLAHCQQAMQTRCLENRVYALTANRFGSDRRPQGELRFTGRSQITAPDGTVLRRAPAQRRELYLTDITPAWADDKHITATNDLLADRRPEFYHLKETKDHVISSNR